MFSTVASHRRALIAPMFAAGCLAASCLAAVAFAAAGQSADQQPAVKQRLVQKQPSGASPSESGGQRESARGAGSVAGIRAVACFLRVKEEADIPALERGNLQSIQVEPGDDVASGQVVANLNGVEQGLILDQARLDLSIAEKKLQQSVAVPIAESALAEAAKALAQARLECDIAVRVAASDIPIRQAEKDLLLSESELERAAVSRRAFSSSVSEQQIDRLTQTRDTDQLKLEKSRYDQTTEQLRCRSKEALVEQHEAAVARLQHAVTDARTTHAIAEIQIQSLRKAVDIAAERVERRTLRAPLNGIVVERLRHTGEWVEAGDAVLRVIRMDQLLVQGFVDARLVNQQSRGRAVRVQCEAADGTAITIDGRLVFISPEFDANNNQVLVRAEIGNPKLALRPGQPAEMDILPAP